MACRKAFTTTESIDLSSVIKIKASAKTTAYQPGLLLASLLRACDHRDDQASSAFYLLQICQEALLKKATANHENPTPRDLALLVASILERFDTLAWAKYCSYHTIAFKKTRLKPEIPTS